MLFAGADVAKENILQGQLVDEVQYRSVVVLWIGHLQDVFEDLVSTWKVEIPVARDQQLKFSHLDNRIDFLRDFMYVLRNLLADKLMSLSPDMGNDTIIEPLVWEKGLRVHLFLNFFHLHSEPQSNYCVTDKDTRSDSIWSCLWQPCQIGLKDTIEKTGGSNL